MAAIIFILTMASAFLILSIFLFRGKGSFLISGYNTSSKEEQEKYDKQKLCKATGFITLIVSILLFIMAYLGYKVETGLLKENQMLPFAIVFIVVIITSIIFVNVYINKKCKKTN